VSAFSLCVVAFVVGIPLVAVILDSGWPMIGFAATMLAFFGLVLLVGRMER
jgi:hypothetical protein